jgi:dihydrofolate reductase
MRKIIAAIHCSLDGYVEGPAGELDWIDDWEDSFGLLPRVDTFILGGGTYPGYAEYWRAIAADPAAPVPFTGRPATPGEVRYARFAARTPHVVLSTRLATPDWPVARVVRDLQAIRELKRLPGRDMHAVGGARLIGSLLEAGLVDELQLIVHPVLLGGGKALFERVRQRQALRTLQVSARPAGAVELRFALGAG